MILSLIRCFSPKNLRHQNKFHKWLLEGIIFLFQIIIHHLDINEWIINSNNPMLSKPSSNQMVQPNIQLPDTKNSHFLFVRKQWNYFDSQCQNNSFKSSQKNFFFWEKLFNNKFLFQILSSLTFRLIFHSWHCPSRPQVTLSLTLALFNFIVPNINRLELWIKLLNFFSGPPTPETHTTPYYHSDKKTII